mgnify:CR=1 FL=1
MDVRRKYQHRIVFQRDMLKAITQPPRCFPEEKQLEKVSFETRILHQYTTQPLVCISIEVEVYTTFRFAEGNICKFFGTNR